ncbi:MAG: alpha-amylase family glycosyl hydrolase [Thomasclavelia ramosa]
MYYLHLYTKEQPDLNWENEKEMKYINDGVVANKGIDGFRMDVINQISKDFEMDKAIINDRICMKLFLMDHST